MKKLKLEIESLAVDTFATADADRGRGTVDAHLVRPTLRTVCDETLLVSNPTCCPCTPMI
jgi:hypothetical protein